MELFEPNVSVNSLGSHDLDLDSLGSSYFALSAINDYSMY